MSRFVDCGRDQAFLLPPDLRDWIPEDDLAHFVIEAVERVDMGAFKVNRRGSGSALRRGNQDETADAVMGRGINWHRWSLYR